MAFRVAARCLAAVSLLAAITWSRDLVTLAGRTGLLAPISRAPDVVLVLLPVAIAGTAAFLLWKPRSAAAAVALYASITGFQHVVPILAYGVFTFLQIGMFYISAANVAASAFGRSSPAAARAESIVGLFFRVHIAMAYFFSGLSKAIGPDWWSGESLWRALNRSDVAVGRWVGMEWAAGWPLVVQSVGIAVVLIEILYFLAFFRPARRVLVPAMVAIHFGTIVLQELPLFGLTMIALNLFFWLDAEGSGASAQSAT